MSAAFTVNLPSHILPEMGKTAFVETIDFLILFAVAARGLADGYRVKSKSLNSLELVLKALKRQSSCPQIVLYKYGTSCAPMRQVSKSNSKLVTVQKS